MAKNGDRPEEERKPTERVVLQRVDALVLDGVSEQSQEAIRELIKADRKSTFQAAQTWLEVARVAAPSKLAAIEEHAGKPGTPNAKVGVYRAPTLTSWKDGVSYEAPPAPLVQRSAVD